MLTKAIVTVTLCLLVGCASSRSTHVASVDDVSVSPSVANTPAKNAESDLSVISYQS